MTELSTAFVLGWLGGMGTVIVGFGLYRVLVAVL